MFPHRSWIDPLFYFTHTCYSSHVRGTIYANGCCELANILFLPSTTCFKRAPVIFASSLVCLLIVCCSCTQSVSPLPRKPVALFTACLQWEASLPSVEALYVCDI